MVEVKFYFLFCLVSGFWPFFLVEYDFFFVVLCLAGNGSCNTQIDSGISQAIQNSSKILMSKNIFSDNRIETTITAEKYSFKSTTTDVWPSYGFFKQQPCDFGVEKENVPEN